MNEIKKLPDAEFEVMKVVWSNDPPVTANIVMEQLGKKKKVESPDSYFSYASVGRTWFPLH